MDNRTIIETHVPLWPRMNRQPRHSLFTYHFCFPPTIFTLVIKDKSRRQDIRSSEVQMSKFASTSHRIPSSPPPPRQPSQPPRAAGSSNVIWYGVGMSPDRWRSNKLFTFHLFFLHGPRTYMFTSVSRSRFTGCCSHGGGNSKDITTWKKKKVIIIHIL